MKYDRAQHHRRSIRLRGYDYTQAGAYFVTVCTLGRVCLFGNVVDGVMRPTAEGQIVHDEWMKSAIMRPQMTLDMFVVMPNHVHGIIVLADDRGVLFGRGTLQRAPTEHAPTAVTQRAPTTERFGKPTSDSIPTIIRLFKSATTKRINESRGTPATPVWQRNYYEHIIRNDDSLSRIQQYIQDNPLRWTFDRENPQAAVARAHSRPPG